jgi:hypothetical protein
MKRTVAVLSLLLTLAISVFGQNVGEEQVRATFDGYKTAIANGKGEEAIRYIDSKTVMYYNHLLDLIKNADFVKLDKLPITDKILILSIRHRLSREKILSFDGRKLLAYSITSKMAGKSDVGGLNIGDVTIDGNFAKGQIEVGGIKSTYYLHFYNEEGKWKMNQTSLLYMPQSILKKMAADSGKSENDFIFMLLKALTGKTPDKDIWQPIG